MAKLLVIFAFATMWLLWAQVIFLGLAVRFPASAPLFIVICVKIAIVGSYLALVTFNLMTMEDLFKKIDTKVVYTKEEK